MLMMMQAMMGAATVPLASGPAFGPSAFVITVRIDSDGDSFTWPHRHNKPYDVTFDWGDGTSEYITSEPSAHVYASAGDYDVVITGTCGPPRFGGKSSAQQIIDVKQWGSLVNDGDWRDAFGGCINMAVSATDPLTGITQMGAMFFETPNANPDASNWDVSNCTDFYAVFASNSFERASPFNADISGWDVSSATDMQAMFGVTTAFNADISGWDVSSVTNMSSMFVYASAFDRDLSGWCVTNIQSEPSGFSEGGALQPQHHPVWGTCP